MSTLLGLDLGTSSFKVSAYDVRGTLRGTVSRATPWRDAPAGQELDPDDFGVAVQELVDECAERFAHGSVAACGVTGMAETMFVDTADGARLPARAWNQRGSAVPPDPLPPEFARTGLIDSARTPLVELRRLTRTGVAVTAWTGLPEQAVRVLGGRRAAERSLAARTGLIDVPSGGWGSELIAWAGVAGADPPPLVSASSPVGTIRRGRAAGAVLAIAGHDHVTASVGADAGDGSVVFDSLGTGEALITRVADSTEDISEEDVARFVAAGYNLSFGLRENDVIAFGGLGTGNRYNVLLDALESAGYARADVYDEHFAPAGGAQRDSAERQPAELADILDRAFGPDWQALKNSGDATAAVQRAVADIDDARSLWWAAVLRSGRTARVSLDALFSLVPHRDRVVAAGGWLANAGIRRVRARTMGAFDVPDVAQAGTRGAALLAGLAAGVYASSAELPPLAPIQETR